MRPSFHVWLGIAAFLIGCPAPAFAGMPSWTLTDVARIRIQTISFFLAGFLLSSWLLQLLWNRLGRDFAWLPRLSYGKAVGVVTLWGLLFLLVLTMISGARELLTPGAWEKQGATYRLTQGPTSTSNEDSSERVRQEKLERLRQALWQYAQAHQGRFPSDRSDPWISREVWQVPDASEMRYVYVPGRKADDGIAPLVYEPDLFGVNRLVLYTNGEIRSVHGDELASATAVENP
jgi:hypothetical protein